MSWLMLRCWSEKIIFYPCGSYESFLRNPNIFWGFPDSSVGKETACQCRRRGDTGLIPASGRSPGVGNSNLLQYNCLENSTDRDAWQAIVHGITKSQTWLSDWTTTKALLQTTYTCSNPTDSFCSEPELENLLPLWGPSGKQTFSKGKARPARWWLQTIRLEERPEERESPHRFTLPLRPEFLSPPGARWKWKGLLSFEREWSQYTETMARRAPSQTLLSSLQGSPPAMARNHKESSWTPPMVKEHVSHPDRTGQSTKHFATCHLLWWK